MDLPNLTPAASPTLYYKVIWVSPKIGVFPSGTLFLTPDLKKISPRKSIALSTKLVAVVVGLRHVYDNRRVVAVSYKSINSNALTQLLRIVVDLLCNLFLRS